jgi:hypothetical protein
VLSVRCDVDLVGMGGCLKMEKGKGKRPNPTENEKEKKQRNKVE